MIDRWGLALASMLLFAAAALGEDNRYTPIQPTPLGDVLLSLPTSHIPDVHTWEVRFTHRFNQPIDQGNFSDRVHSLFGLDSNADVGIGFSYVPRPRFQLSLYRSNAMDDIEIAAKYLVFQQASAIPLSAAVRVGADWRTESNITKRTSAFGQAILSRQFGKHAEVFMLPTVVTEAGRQVVGVSSAPIFRVAVNVPMGAALIVRDGLSVVAEFVPKNRDLPLFIRSDPAWALGIKRAMGSHFFEIFFTNSNATHIDQYVTTTYMGAALQKSAVHLGFNIERRWGQGARR